VCVCVSVCVCVCIFGGSCEIKTSLHEVYATLQTGITKFKTIKNLLKDDKNVYSDVHHT